jgi:protein translocase SecG subunit
MFQSGKESGLSGALSGKNDTYLSKIGGLDKKLAAATKWIALVWGVFTLALCILNAI